MQLFNAVGTAALTAWLAHCGDSPVKNWGGVGVVDFSDVAQINGDAVDCCPTREEIHVQALFYRLWRPHEGWNGRGQIASKASAHLNF